MHALTVNELINKLQLLVTQNSEIGNLPIVNPTDYDYVSLITEPRISFVDININNDSYICSSCFTEDSYEKIAAKIDKEYSDELPTDRPIIALQFGIYE